MRVRAERSTGKVFGSMGDSIHAVVHAHVITHETATIAHARPAHSRAQT